MNSDSPWLHVAHVAAGAVLGGIAAAAAFSVASDRRAALEYRRGYGEGQRKGFNDGTAYGREDAVIFPPEAARLREQARAQAASWEGYKMGRNDGRELERRDRGFSRPSEDTKRWGTVR